MIVRRLLLAFSPDRLVLFAGPLLWAWFDFAGHWLGPAQLVFAAEPGVEASVSMAGGTDSTIDALNLAGSSANGSCPDSSNELEIPSPGRFDARALGVERVAQVRAAVLGERFRIDAESARDLASERRLGSFPACQAGDAVGRGRRAPLLGDPVAFLAWDGGELSRGRDRTYSRSVPGAERACVAVGGGVPGG